MSCSRLAGIMGLSRWSTPNDELKKSLLAHGASFGEHEVEPTKPLFEAAEVGTYLENAILELGIKRLGFDLTDADLNITEPVSSNEINLHGSLDGVLKGDGRIVKTDRSKGIVCYGQDDQIKLEGMGILEAKFTTALPAPEPELYRGVVQCQGLQLCTDYKWHCIVTLFGKTGQLVCYLNVADPAMQFKIKQEVAIFDRKINDYNREKVVDFYIPITSNDAAKTYAKSEPDLPAITLTPEATRAALALSEAKKQRQECDKAVDRLNTYLMSILGIHEKGQSSDGLITVTWPTNKERNSYVVEARPAARSKSLKLKIIDGGLADDTADKTTA